MKQLFESIKEFRLWNASASHNKLLLRSHSVEYGEKITIDIIFQGVVKIYLPTTLHGLKLAVTTVNMEQKMYQQECRFVIKSRDVEYYVEACKVTVYLNDLSSSFDSLEVNVEPDLLGVKIAEYIVGKQS